jgi:hypothetical protein
VNEKYGPNDSVIPGVPKTAETILQTKKKNFFSENFFHFSRLDLGTA